MKSEDRIVELLAESLKRQDQLVDEVRQMRGGIQEMRSDIGEMRGDVQEMKSTMTRVVKAVDSLVDVVKVALDRKEMDSVKERLARLERHIGLDN